MNERIKSDELTLLAISFGKVTRYNLIDSERGEKPRIVSPVSPEPLNSPVTRQPKSSSRRAMPKCHVCGRILTNLVSRGVWSLFITTSVASLLAWKTCNVRCRAVREGHRPANHQGLRHVELFRITVKKKVNFSFCSNLKTKKANFAKSFGRKGYFASGLRANRGRSFQKENTPEAKKEKKSPFTTKEVDLSSVRASRPHTLA